MAGEIEEPFELDFRVDSFHSGSISFGRFESEELCWERRSSFSHNRYLEEVEKCSKPGSVTEKKAYFEAHFRKKGFPVVSSPECWNVTDYQTSENDISEKMGNDKEIDHVNGSNCSAQFDESLDGWVHGGDHEVTECEPEVLRPQFELASHSISNVDCIPEHVKVDKADHAELRNSIPINSESGIEMKEKLEGETANSDTRRESNMAIGLSPDNCANEEISNASAKDQQSSSDKEIIQSKSEHTKPRLILQVTVGQGRRYGSRNTFRGSENKATKQVSEVPVRSKAKTTSEDPNKCQMHKNTKYEHGSKMKGVNEINSGHKEPRNRTIVDAQSSTSQVANRAYQPATRVKPVVGVTKRGTRQDTSRSSFKSNKLAHRRKEEKPQAEFKQFRKSLSYKSTPTPSHFGGASCVSDGNKYTKESRIISNTEPQKQHAKSSIPRMRLSGSSQLSTKAQVDQATLISAYTKTADPTQPSGVTSTSRSSASSSGGAGKAKPSQAGISLISRRKEPEKEKLTSLHKHKISEGIQFCKGKTFDGKQKTRIGSSTIASLNGSSRTSRMAVGVAS